MLLKDVERGRREFVRDIDAPLMSNALDDAIHTFVFHAHRGDLLKYAEPKV